MELAGRWRVVEDLPDGRQLVEPEAFPGMLVVVGRSTRPAEAARMGYRTARSVRPAGGPFRRVVVLDDPRPESLHSAARSAALPDRRVAERRAEDLFVSLLDADQRKQWREHRACWVSTPRGPVRLGRLHDLRFRPSHSPGREVSLCVVPSGPPLPMGDVWTNLLLVLAVDPDSFFGAANVRSRGRPTPPHPP
jgi:hypothetical protein